MPAYRRAAAIGTVVLAIAAGLVAVSPAADAADPCYSERQPTGPLGLPSGAGCDDTVPPETTIDSPTLSTPWLRSTSVTIAFHGAHPDADTDAIGYECQFYDSVSAPTTWQSCTSPFTQEGLTENGATPYTFRVRAVDTLDDAHDLTTDAWPYTGSTDAPDHDQTPAQLMFTVDATAPNTFGFLRTSYPDESGFDGPMLVEPSAQLRLQSTQGTSYRCSLNGKAVACNDGLTTLRNLTPGGKRFSAAAVDPAGNVDPSPFVQEFFVPRNLALGDADRASRGDWRRFRDPGGFGGDYLETSTYGAVLSFPVRNVREIQLLAPAGPQLGRVEIRVGRGRWYPVDLHSKDPAKLKVYAVRDAISGLLAGTLQVRVASHGKPVRVDAVSAR
ncbi:hypothetical protein [Nocardioides sp. URHA0032]|uniref:hypothetical protein n=1 Tax=Nocardioides sp. URHA0032 TaxID=1380388 RepID=UPI0004918F83|nr:hypothetical protein [Nocardioides sp. URHA0032]